MLNNVQDPKSKPELKKECQIARSPKSCKTTNLRLQDFCSYMLAKHKDDQGGRPSRQRPFTINVMQ